MNFYIKSSDFIIINDDILKTSEVPPDCIDLIITSPPYNLDISYNSHKDNLSYSHYIEFSKKWMGCVWNFLKEDGRLCINIPLDVNKGGRQTVYSDLAQIAKKIGFGYHTTIVWNKQSLARFPGEGHGSRLWGSYMSASSPSVITPVETILVLYKNQWKKNHKGVSDITKREFIDWTNGLWTFSGESRNKIGHPAPFPIELPRRCIKLFSYVGDIVLDPFMGSGTTLVACRYLNRKGIGVEIDKKYCGLAIDRLDKLK